MSETVALLLRLRSARSFLMEALEVVDEVLAEAHERYEGMLDIEVDDE